ncbi:hypothetical protein [Gordonia alkaliphila]|uniref:Glycosyltransferase family 39 protein n=1 Tax=Gordonia alkaliphila TaxID=1053547 RepID=A0ABP8Z4D7_9ACTN
MSAAVVTDYAPEPSLAQSGTLYASSSAAIAPLSAVLTALALGLTQLIAIRGWADRHDLRGALMQWDSLWMTNIAEHGYLGFSIGDEPIRWQSVAFFPGYPTLVRIVASPMTIFGVHDATYIAAVIVSTASCVALAAGLAVLALQLWRRLPDSVRLPPPTTRAQVCVAVAVTVLAFGAPMSVIYWMPYSESLFTASAVWALVLVLRRQYLAAGLLVLVAGLTRLTASALVLTLCAVAVVELWQWARRRTEFPVAAVLAPIIGSAGIGGYLLWADATVADIGGYFAAQDRGWGSGFDWGSSTLDWLANNLALDVGDATGLGLGLSSWSMILVAGLIAVSLWPLLGRWLPWPVWLTATTVALIVLGSGGIMHSRPRLLLLPTLLLMIPFVVRATRWASRQSYPWLWVILGVEIGGLWCGFGFWVSGHMLIDFDYGI